MKLAAIGLGLAAAIGLGTATGDDPPAQGGPPGAKPTPQHKVLAREAGVWDATIRDYSQGPEASESKGVETNTLIGGLWLISDFQGSAGGVTFRGHGLYGYDPKKGKYVGSWVDTLSSEMNVLEGTYDEASRTMTMTGEATDPASGRKFKEKLVTKFDSDDARTFTFFIVGGGPNGSDQKLMEIAYKKRAK